MRPLSKWKHQATNGYIEKIMKWVSLQWLSRQWRPKNEMKEEMNLSTYFVSVLHSFISNKPSSTYACVGQWWSIHCTVLWISLKYYAQKDCKTDYEMKEYNNS